METDPPTRLCAGVSLRYPVTLTRVMEWQWRWRPYGQSQRAGAQTRQLSRPTTRALALLRLQHRCPAPVWNDAPSMSRYTAMEAS